MDINNLTLLGDRVLIKRYENISGGKLLLPSTFNAGTVFNAEIIKVSKKISDLKPAMKVLVTKNQGTELKKNFFIIDKKDIKAILNEHI
ncbi:hypothetical protein [Apibacter mensalis]|uniref:hypothetical protein n=1 Tax=Apibacter mensalis TaxID=1586267 RepID=UPI0026EA519D|nr:hypothetical protein [Apibacter mensalis]